MRFAPILIAALAACAGGCAAGGMSEADLADAQACLVSDEGGFAFWSGSKAMQPGETAELAPIHYSSRGGVEAMPASCISAIEPPDPALATIERPKDGPPLLRIAADAPSGAAIELRGLFRGVSPVRGTVEVYRPEDAPLVGTWRQAEDGQCPASEFIRELVFRPGGGIAVTWMPFESYVDYWGTYKFDPASGALTLEATGGNEIPGDVASGTVRLDGDRMAMETASFGHKQPGTACKRTFIRRR